MKVRKPSSWRGLFLSVSFLSSLGVLMVAQSAADQFLLHPAFLVREVEVRWLDGSRSRPARFRLNPPTSVFRVDLKALSNAFQRRYPAAEVENVERILPNRLRATLRARHLVGQVQAGRLYFPVSDDGVVTSAGSAGPRTGLPLLQLEGVRRSLRAGEALESPGFWKAAELLATLRRGGGVAGHRARSVRVSGQDLFLTLDSGAEVRFSVDRLPNGWQLLAGLLSQRPRGLQEANYIDLRFEDPVIGSKTVKRKGRS